MTLWKRIKTLRRSMSRPGRQLRYIVERWHAERSAKPGCFPFVIVLDGLNAEINPGQIMRSADAFGARAVYAIGLEYFDVAPAVGSVRNVPHAFFDDFASVHAKLRAEGYTFYALEPIHDLGEPRYIDETTLAAKAAFVVGNESRGISFRPADHPDVEWIAIRQFGTVPCLNVAHATTVAMYAYTTQHGRPGR